MSNLPGGRMVTRYTVRGFPYQVWEPPMPRIQDNILDCVLYLYPSKEEAMAGEHIGGSGFLMEVNADTIPGAVHYYAVTNKHVIEQGLGAPCIRLNTASGEMDAFKYTKNDWDVSKTDDLAILRLPNVGDVFKIHAIPSECLVTKQFIVDHDVGIGDEVLMIGRFINREGKQRNSPTARFGHIAQMPGDAIPIEINKKSLWQEDAFLIETRSIGGFSGSPVYVIPDKRYQRKGKFLPTDKATILGVDFCHITNSQPAQNPNDAIIFAEHTGMAGVVPAWKLEAHLNSEKQKNLRRAIEEDERTSRARSRFASADSVAPPASDVNPNHREGFTRLLNAAAQKREQED